MTGERVLVVDDEAGIRKMFRRHLERSGYHIFEACSCEDAIQILKHEEIDVILLDIIMPKMNGVMCLGNIKSKFQEIPVIMVTGVNDIQTGVEVMKKGAFDYIVKPAKKNELLNAVGKAIKFKKDREAEERSELFKIHYVLLLDNAGLVMFHKNLDPNFKLEDDDLFGSMFTAIKMFIKDSLHIAGGLKNIDHGDYKILVEDGPNFYMAVIGQGKNIDKIREKMKEIVTNIINDYGIVITDWDGDLGRFDGIEKEFQELIVDNKFESELSNYALN